MNSFASPKVSSRPVLKISIPRFKNTTSSRSIAVILRPWSSSSFSWRRFLLPSRKKQSFHDSEVFIADDSSSVSSVTLVGSPTEETCTSPKMVRFNDSPAYFSAKQRIKTPKSLTKKVALRSCLVVHKPNPFTESLSDDADDISVYEDCLSTYPGFSQDFEDLLEREHLKQMKIENSRPPSWQLTEFGYMDTQDYLSYCRSRYAEKKRQKEIEDRWKVVYDHPMTLRWPSREIAERPVKSPPSILATPPRLFVPQPAPVILSWRQRIVCDITDMLVVLCIGLAIHGCIYTLGLYCFFTGVFLDDEE
ncbi:hypothetical protein AZE42_08855 [Rhizopogon vesiculosus]|uniref:Uncharacterized protein n=1 Tax=Rhizopogon vesiculosus TaxID=180088 RepID=A0A1J8R436_9AGAM|nr:hypothetical protein AZE42_08855 [Rhizopogon vesiculosus]